MDTAYGVLPYLLCRLGLIHHGLYPPSLILALRVLTPLLTGLSQFLSVRIPLGLRLLVEGPGKQYPYEKTGGLEPGRFKPIEEPGAEEKDPVVFTGLKTVWVTVSSVSDTLPFEAISITG
jgi:hypothetical protein